MASGIYKSTMRRPSPAEPAEKGPAKAAEQGPAKAAAGPGAGDPGSGDDSAQPLIGKRTIYVDRQVARRARSRSKTKKILRLKMLIALLLLGLILVIMGWILAWAKLQEAEQRTAEVDAELRTMELKMEETRGGMEAREREMASLMDDRIPGLSEIIFNTLLDINDKYVLNITFSETGVGKEKALEYHAMLVNSGTRIVLPQVKIIVFNEFGLQVGKVTLAKGHATSPVALAELEPGETRSYHAQVNIELDSAPKYFLLDVK